MYKHVGNMFGGDFKSRRIKNLYTATTTVCIPGMPYHRSAIGTVDHLSFILGTTVHPHIPFRYIGVEAGTYSTAVRLNTYELVAPGMLIEATYTGTASTDFIPGLQNIKVSTAGSATGTTGAIPPVLSTSTECGTTNVLEHAIIESVDSANSKVRFYFERITT